LDPASSHQQFEIKIKTRQCYIGVRSLTNGEEQFFLEPPTRICQAYINREEIDYKKNKIKQPHKGDNNKTNTARNTNLTILVNNIC
jgi:hypothetical protein